MNARRVTALKILLSAFALIAGIAFLAHQWRTHRMGLSLGNLYFSAGDYQWLFYPSQRELAGWFGGIVALLVLCDYWPVQWCPRSRAGQCLAFSAALAWAAGLLAMQWLRVYELPGIYWLTLGAGSLGTAYYLVFRPAGNPALARFANAVERGRGARIWIPLLVLAAFAFYWIGCHAIFSGQTIMTDSQSQIAQARLLLTCHWTLDIPQRLRDAIAFPYAIRSVPSYAQYAPGHIFLLMPFIKLGLPLQLPNMLAGGLTLFTTVLLARRLEGPAAALATGLVMLGSPFLLLMNSSAMNHSTASLELWIATWCFMPPAAGTPQRSPRAALWLALLGGFALGWATMTRPLTALAHAAVWLGVWLTMLFGAADRRRVWLQGLAALAGLIPPAVLFMIYNAHTTGHALQLGYEVSNADLHRLGFHAASHPGGLSYTPRDALQSAVADFASLNWQMTGLAVGSWLAMLVWWLRTRLPRHQIVIISLIAAQIFFYKLYQFHDLFFGPRFLFEIIPGFMLLIGAGLGRTLRRGGLLAGATLTIVFILALGACGDGLGFWPRTFATDVQVHGSIERRMSALLPNREPLAIVISDANAERIGRWFPADPGRPPVWFIPASKEALARRLPELASCRWVILDQSLP